MIGENPITFTDISYLVHCNRRYYLSKVESQHCDENVYLEDGRQVHENVHVPAVYRENDVLVMTDVMLYSHQYGLYGFCDKIEFRPSEDGVDMVEPVKGRYEILVIEYKRGKTRQENSYIAQVVAQILCIEEMYKCRVKKGCLYFVESKTSYVFDITPKYRQMVLDAVNFIQTYDGHLIKPRYFRKCHGCSLYDVCQPRTHCVKDYMDDLWEW